MTSQSDGLYVRFIAHDPEQWEAARELLANFKDDKKFNELKQSPVFDLGPWGIFAACDALFQWGKLHPNSVKFLKGELSWFNKHVPVPKLRRAQQDAIFWFQPKAAKCIERAWGLVLILREYVPVYDHSTTNPGEIIYEDQFQVAAIPPVDQVGKGPFRG